MNLALLVTKKNLEEMTTTARKMGEMQESQVNGAFCVFFDTTIPKEKIAALVAPISKKFAALSFGPVQINSSMSNDLQVAVLFGTLIMQAYSRFPGAWLVVDSLSIPLVKDFMQASEKQHRSLGGNMTGRGVEGKGSILPVGPVTLSLPHKAIKFLRYPVSTSWRERGQFQFTRCGFAKVEASDYIWSLSETNCDPKPEPMEAEVEAEAEMDIDEWDKDQLISYIFKASGREPARNTGYPRLIAMAKEISQLVATPA